MKRIVLAFILAAFTAAQAEDLILLVKTSDRAGVAAEEEQKATTWRAGYILGAYPTNRIFSAREKNVANFLRLKIPAASFNPDWVASETNAQGHVVLLRKWFVNFRALVGTNDVVRVRSAPYDYTVCGKYKAFDCDCALCNPGVLTVTNPAAFMVENLWTNRAPPWVAHGSAGTFTIKASGGDYSSLSTWEAAEQCDLTAGGGQGLCIAECYNDWPVLGLSDSVTIAGWTTDADNYVKITTPASERHNGIAKVGASYTGFAIKANVTWGAAIAISENYTVLEGLIIDANDKSGTYAVKANAEYSIVRECILRRASYTSTYGYGNTSGYPRGHLLINSLLELNYVGVRVYSYTYNQRIFNCTIADNANGGLYFHGGGTPTRNHYVKNCLFYNNGGVSINNANPNATIHVEYTSTDDDKADDFGGSGNRTNQTFSFVDAAANDFHLALTDTGAKTFATNLSADAFFPFNWDIDGDTRGTIWDIGADQATFEYRAFMPAGRFVAPGGRLLLQQR